MVDLAFPGPNSWSPQVVRQPGTSFSPTDCVNSGIFVVTSGSEERAWPGEWVTPLSTGCIHNSLIMCTEVCVKLISLFLISLFSRALTAFSYSLPFKTLFPSWLLLRTPRFTCTMPRGFWAGNRHLWTMAQDQWSTGCSLNSKPHVSFGIFGGSCGESYGTLEPAPSYCLLASLYQICGKQIFLLYF
jgi:hypothetical protein